jgi:hypothetical protein
MLVIGQQIRHNNQGVPMAIEALSEKDRDLVLRCMKAAAAYIDDPEKHARLGLDPEDLHRVIAQWPQIEDHDESGVGFLAINNSMNEVCHGFRIAPADWPTWFDVSLREVESTYRKWLACRRISGGIR